MSAIDRHFSHVTEGSSIMFRKRTDQVYSTLQQVQRRITEQAGGNAGQVGDEFRSAPPQSLVTLQPLSQALPMQQPSAVPAPQLPPAMQPGKRYVLQLSGDLAMLLMVVWLVSMALMFYLGKNWHGVSGAGLAAGDAGHRGEAVSTDATPGPRRQGDYVLVLKSMPTASAADEAALQGQARDLNDYVIKNPGRNLKPYFGVRKPESGGLQLVFGLIGGQFGINKEEFITTAEVLAKPQSQGGAGYKSANWMKVEDR